MTETTLIANQLLGAILSGQQSESLMAACIAAGMDESWLPERDQRTLWAVLVALFQQGRQIYLPEVELAAKTAGAQFTHNASEWFCDLVDNATFNATPHIELLRSSAMLEVTRRALAMATALAKDATPDTAQESIATIRNMIMTAELDAPEADIHPADTAIEQVNEWRTTDILNRNGLHWFLPTIDRTVGPLTDELVYLNSMPSVGKTAFSLNMVCAAAWSGVRCSFVSLESPRSKIAQRLTSIISGHNANALKFRRTIDAHYDEAVEKLNAFKKMPSGWTFTARSIEQIYSWARTEQKRGSRAIIIDNMKHIRTGKSDSTVEQFRELSLRLKEMKDMLGMAVMVLHHLNDDGKVSWSRDIERDADIILNLVNADNDLAAEVRRVKFICQKNRDGNTGEIPILFHKQTQTFTEVL